MTPTDEQVEAVAKAIAWADRHPFDVSKNPDDLWLYVASSHATYVAKARAAITAMQPTVAQAAVAKATRALKPFANCVFNDNGDITISDTHRLTHEDYVAAYFALRALTEPQQEDTP